MDDLIMNELLNYKLIHMVNFLAKMYKVGNLEIHLLKYAIKNTNKKIFILMKCLNGNLIIL